MATINVTKENFETLIQQNGIVLLDFWASWCGPCRMFGPVFEKSSEKHTDLVFGKIDTEAQGELSAGFGIRSIPTLMIFRDQVLIFSQPGALPEDALEDVISQVKALDMDQVRQEIEKEKAKQQQQQAAAK